MRVLLDENLPHELRHLFDDRVEAVTVAYQGWAGTKNGMLLRLAEPLFDAVITVDRGISHQNQLASMDKTYSAHSDLDSETCDRLACTLSRKNLTHRFERHGEYRCASQKNNSGLAVQMQAVTANQSTSRATMPV